MHNNSLDGIRKLRQKMVTRGLYTLSTLGLFALIASLSRAFYVGWHNVLCLQILSYILILTVVLLRKHLSFQFQGIFIIGIVFFLGLTGLASWGLAGFGLAALLGFCIITTMIYGTRAGVISTLLSIAVTGVIGALSVNGLLVFNFDPDIYLTSSSSWIMSIISIMLSAGLIVVILGTINDHMLGLINSLDSRNRSLEEANIMLEREIEERKRLEKERMELESRLRRAEKMEIVGTLAGGVAHDLNNILASSVSYPELLLLRLPHDSPLRKPLQKIKNSGMKAATIVQDLLTLARRGVASSQVTNLNLIVTEFMISPELEKIKHYHPNVDIEVDLEKELSNTEGSPVHLTKTLMNLVSNAAEAIKDKGEIIIKTGNRKVTSPIKGYDEVGIGNYNVLAITDTGTGISSEDIEKIFEPFYTKKVMGRSGTGLGMAVVWSTVVDHSGHIDMKSKEGEGTTFTLYFPSTDRPVEKEKPALALDEYMGSGESILVVDDVEEQREIVSNMLNELGYHVKTVSSGEEAVEYMQKAPADLIILDMIMEPGIDGLDTYRKIIDLYPGQKAIIASGFSESDLVREAQRLGAGAYIKKPFLMEDIGVAIRAELDN